MTKSSDTSIVLIVPSYNEEENVPLFVQEAVRELESYDWQIIFVNDGSTDRTWEVIRELAEANPCVHGLCFARNYGHQNALKAGLEEAYKYYEADVYVTLDADLQHPISLIPRMVELWKEGAFIVQSQRRDEHRNISFFKKFSSRAFYAVFSWLSGVSMQPGMSDFRLMNRQTLRFIVGCGEKDFFLRGLLPWSGLKTAILPYKPQERLHGCSKFTLRKMLRLAMSGIVGYSTRPLYLSLVLGSIAILLAAIYFAYVIAVSLTGQGVSLGWPSLMATILALGGTQLFLLGIVGIYLGRLFMEQKGRPSYILMDKTR